MKKTLIAILVLFVLAGVAFAQPAIMTTEYKEGEKIIKHPSGTVSKYVKKDISRQLESLIKQRDHINAEIAKINDEIKDIDKSVAVK